MNYFDNRSTNASAESFNAKIKAFRSQLRGVKNIEFFPFRLTQLYAEIQKKNHSSTSFEIVPIKSNVWRHKKGYIQEKPVVFTTGLL
nr:transposase [Pedobacter sp. N36a]